MKAFLMALVLLAVIAVGAASSVGVFQMSAKDAYTDHQNVRL
jgi:hypothetical protein